MKHKQLAILLTLLSLIGMKEVLAQTADLILTNGKIFTSDTAQVYVEALAIKGNKILAVGSNTAIQKTASGKTKKIDLKGKTVVPGFNDAHDHLGWLSGIGVGYTYSEFNPAGLSKAAVLDSVSRFVKLAKPGQWIRGLIGINVFFDSSVRAAIDSIAPNNPVLLQIWWGHGMVVNKKALEAAGLSDDVKDPVGGRYERGDGTGRITAIQQNAQVPVWNTAHVSEPENQINDMRTYAQKQLQVGITTVQNMSSTLSGPDAFRFFKEADLTH
jgi:predicted amidohydrolase YtcJ